MDQTSNRPRLNGEDRLYIECGFTIDRDDLDSLMQCYQPLIHSYGVSIYLTMASLASIQSYNHSVLCRLCDLDIGYLYQGITLLEQHELLKTYVKAKDLHYEYVYSLVQPLPIHQFFANPLFSRSLANTLGIDQYTQLVKRFPSDLMDLSSYQQVTIPYDASMIKDAWDDHHEASYQNITLKNESDHVIDGFDLSRFLQDMDDFQFPRKYRTDANLRAIAQLANVFGMDEIAMQQAMWRAVNNTGFSLNALMHYCSSHASKVKASDSNRIDMPPALYLQSLKQGVALADFETRAINSLVEKYHFPNGITNTIIQKVIETNKRISKSALDAYASYLVYCKVHNVQEAKKALDSYGSINKTRSYRYQETKPDYSKGKQNKNEIVDTQASDDMMAALKELSDETNGY